MGGWFYEGQHGFRTAYSCASQIVTVCQDIAVSLDGGCQDRLDNNRFVNGFRFGSTRQTAYENRGNRSGFEGSCRGTGISVRAFGES